MARGVPIAVVILRSREDAIRGTQAASVNLQPSLGHPDNKPGDDDLFLIQLGSRLSPG
jgi:hypothetical protein